MNDLAPMHVVGIPGLGGDARLFAPLARHLPVRVAPWLPVRSRDSVGDYAQRLTACDLMQRRPLVVGVSMGGMIALELARRLPVAGVVLISSCRSADAIAPGLRRAEGWTRPWHPQLVRMARAIPPGIWYRSSLRRPWHRMVAAAMAADCDPHLASWAAQAICRWPGVPAPDHPLLRIHGDEDRLIPLVRLDGHPDLVLRGGGHLSVMTRAAQIAPLIDRFHRRLSHAARGGGTPPGAQ
jgi:pimeloyl-ACP methyl ester carboxylesterase